MKKILVVDDVIEVRETLKQILEKEDYEIVTAIDGKDGFAKIFDYDFDMVITDLMMPNMGGFSFIEKLKKNNRTKDLPIMVLTAKNTKDDLLRAIKLGAKEYVIKPFKSQVLRDKVKRCLTAKLIFKMPENKIKVDANDETIVIYFKGMINADELLKLDAYLHTEDMIRKLQTAFSININIYNCLSSDQLIITILESLKKINKYVCIFLTKKNTPINRLMEKHKNKLDFNYL